MSHSFAAGSAVFDDEHLVSYAGRVPVMTLAEQTGLSRRLGEKVHIGLPAEFLDAAVANGTRRGYWIIDNIYDRLLPDALCCWVVHLPRWPMRELWLG